jgi:hypothetical protein
MLYDGKRPEELSNDEIEAAAVYCHRMKHHHALMFEQHDAALGELGEEYGKRLGRDLNLDHMPGTHEIN